MSDYILDTQAAIDLLDTFNGGTTGAADMIVFRAIKRLKAELRTYLTGSKG